MTNDVIDGFLEKLGYSVAMSGKHRQLMKEWHEWYRGKVDSFHNYTVYNGFENVDCEKLTLGMAKRSAEDWADLLLNEKVEIMTASQNELDAILEANNFRDRANQLIELAFALGTGAFVAYASPSRTDRPVTINYINGLMIRPLKIENGEIVDCAFASQLNQDEYYISLHTRQPDGSYRIENIVFSEKSGQYSVKNLPGGVKPIIKSPVKLFWIVKPNLVNNIELDEAMGLSVYANAVDEMKDVDTKYDSYENEFVLGRKRIFVRGDTVQVNIGPDGKPRPAFDTKDTVFYAIPMEDKEAKPIQETDSKLRVEEHDRGLQTALNLFGDKVGFGADHYVFRDGKVYTNEAQVISTNSKMYRRLKKHELLLEPALIGLTQSVLYLLTGKPYTADVSVNFDDSIIEDTAEKKRQALLEFNAGLIDAVEYFKLTRNMDQAAAEKFVQEIEARKPEVEEEPEPEE